jgi:hypothetical protein
VPSAVINIGLVCHPAIRWLVRDRVVNEYIQAFICDRAPSDTFDVSGPPSLEDLKKFRANPEADIRFPTVKLTLKKEKHLDRPVLRVSASDNDLAQVQAWMLRAQSGPLPSLNS